MTATKAYISLTLNLLLGFAVIMLFLITAAMTNTDDTAGSLGGHSTCTYNGKVIAAHFCDPNWVKAHPAISALGRAGSK